MSAPSPSGPKPAASPEVLRARELARRYLDARARWTLDDDDAARALRDADADARRAWARVIATHRAMVGAAAGMPSGVEQRRQMELALARAGVQEQRAPGATRWARWLGITAPLAAAAVLALVLVPRGGGDDADGWIKARGLGDVAWPEARVGLGVGGVSDNGGEYEAIASGRVGLEDWLRLSYTNERADVTSLFVLGLQREGDALALRPIAPLPDEGKSVAIARGRFVQLPFEARLAARHTPGALRLVAIFSARPLDYAAVEAAVRGLDPSELETLPSSLQARLHDRLALAPDDVVQVLDTRIVPGSATSPPAPRQETP